MRYRRNFFIEFSPANLIVLPVDAKLKYRPQIDDLAEDEDEGEENVDGMRLVHI